MDEELIKKFKLRLDEWAEFLSTDLTMLGHYLDGESASRKIISREERIAERIEEIMGDAYMIVALAKKLLREVN